MTIRTLPPCHQTDVDHAAVLALLALHAAGHPCHASGPAWDRLRDAIADVLVEGPEDAAPPLLDAALQQIQQRVTQIRSLQIARGGVLRTGPNATAH